MHVLAVARLKSLWISLCTTHVTARGIPFPNNDWIHQMPAPELEIATREALDRDRRLRSQDSCTMGIHPRAKYIGRWAPVYPSSKSSSFLTLADARGASLWFRKVPGVRSVCGIIPWSGRRSHLIKGSKFTIFCAIAINSNPRSEASAAVAVALHG